MQSILSIAMTVGTVIADVAVMTFVAVAVYCTLVVVDDAFVEIVGVVVPVMDNVLDSYTLESMELCWYLTKRDCFVETFGYSLNQL